MPFLRDFFYGLRLFRRNPGFYLLAVLIVSLGIGATTAIFSLIDGVLLNPLPYRDAERLAVIWSDFSRLGGSRRCCHLWGHVALGCATQEMGIRIAIGASPSDVVWPATNQGLQAAAAGLAVGLVGYFAMSRMLAGQLFGVSATDPITLFGAAAGLMFVCLAASAFPAFRAAPQWIDPFAA